MTGTQGEGHLTETTAHGWGPAHDRRRTHYLKALELLGNHTIGAAPTTSKPWSCWGTHRQ